MHFTAAASILTPPFLENPPRGPVESTKRAGGFEAISRETPHQDLCWICLHIQHRCLHRYNESENFTLTLHCTRSLQIPEAARTSLRKQYTGPNLRIDLGTDLKVIAGSARVAR